MLWFVFFTVQMIADLLTMSSFVALMPSVQRAKSCFTKYFVRAKSAHVNVEVT
jgi:hypothetical protein